MDQSRLDANPSQAQSFANYTLIHKGEERHCEIKCLPLPKNTTQQNLAKVQSLATPPLSQCHVSHLKSTPLNTAYVKRNTNSNYKTTTLNRFTLSILLPTSIFMMSFFVEYISTSFSHSSSFSNVSLLLVSYTKGKETRKNKVTSVLEASLVPLAFFLRDVMLQ